MFFNLFGKRKLYTIDELNERIERKDHFYYDAENECIRIKDTELFEELNDLTFTSVNDKEVPTYTTKAGFIIGDLHNSGVTFYNGNMLREEDLLNAIVRINYITDRAEKTIKTAVETYRKNKDYVFSPTLAILSEKNNYVFGNAIRACAITEYFGFLQPKCEYKYLDEYKKYVLRAFKLSSTEEETKGYQYDTVRFIEPYITWLDKNKEKIDVAIKRREENEKCKHIFTMIKETI